MDPILETVITSAPMFIGLAWAVWILKTQNDRLMNIIEIHLRECHGAPMSDENP